MAATHRSARPSTAPERRRPSRRAPTDRRHLIGGYLARKPHSFDDLGPGQAAILKVDGHNVAGYRDPEGTLHACSAVCTHMGCLVGWNGTDRTWDCPCHGSRFALDGEVIHGPAVKPLEPVEVKAEAEEALS